MHTTNGFVSGGKTTGKTRPEIIPVRVEVSDCSMVLNRGGVSAHTDLSLHGDCVLCARLGLRHTLLLGS